MMPSNVLMTTARRLSVAAIAAASALLVLTGCTGVMEQLRNESSSRFASTTELDDEWGRTAPWLPDDASGIRVKESIGGDPAVLRAVTSTELDPEQCTDVERQSAPTFGEDWSPDPYVETVLICGGWAVIPTR